MVMCLTTCDVTVSVKADLVTAGTDMVTGW